MTRRQGRPPAPLTVDKLEARARVLEALTARGLTGLTHRVTAAIAANA